MVEKKLTVKKKINKYHDGGIDIRWEVSDGWTFPTKTMAKAHAKRWSKKK